MRSAIIGIVFLFLTAPVIAREVPNRPLGDLMHYELDLTTRVRSVTSRGEGRSDTVWTYVLEIERVHRGADPERGFEVGGEVTVLARTRRLARGTVGSTGHRAGFGGENGLPQQGDRVRVHLRDRDGTLAVGHPNGFQPVGTRVVLVTDREGSDAYHAMRSLQKRLNDLSEISAEIIVVDGIAERAADPTIRGGSPDAALLGSAHLCVMHIGESESTEYAMLMTRFARSGRPLVGLAGAAQPFRFSRQHALHTLSSRFSEAVFGLSPSAPSESEETRAFVLEAPRPGVAEHPILAPRPGGAESGLRFVTAAAAREPASDCLVLLSAVPAPAEGGAGPADQTNLRPVLWVRENGPVLEDPFDNRPARPPLRTAFLVPAPWSVSASPELEDLLLRVVLWAAGELDPDRTQSE